MTILLCGGSGFISQKQSEVSVLDRRNELEDALKPTEQSLSVCMCMRTLCLCGVWVILLKTGGIGDTKSELFCVLIWK